MKDNLYTVDMATSSYHSLETEDTEARKSVPELDAIQQLTLFELLKESGNFEELKTNVDAVGKAITREYNYVLYAHITALLMLGIQIMFLVVTLLDPKQTEAWQNMAFFGGHLACAWFYLTLVMVYELVFFRPPFAYRLGNFCFVVGFALLCFVNVNAVEYADLKLPGTVCLLVGSVFMCLGLKSTASCNPLSLFRTKNACWWGCVFFLFGSVMLELDELAKGKKDMVWQMNKNVSGYTFTGLILLLLARLYWFADTMLALNEVWILVSQMEFHKKEHVNDSVPLKCCMCCSLPERKEQRYRKRAYRKHLGLLALKSKCYKSVSFLREGSLKLLTHLHFHHERQHQLVTRYEVTAGGEVRAMKVLRDGK